MRTNSVRRAAVGLLAAAVLSACSSSLTGTGSSAPNQASANAFMQEIGSSFSHAMQQASYSRQTPLATYRPESLLPETGPVMTSPLATAPVFALAPQATGPSLTAVNVSVSHQTTCTSGGALDIEGSLTGNIDSTGSGMLQIQMTETINGWTCIQPFTFNGAPYLSAAGTFTFLNGQLATAASIEFGGGFSWTGNGGSGTCSINVTMNFNPDNTGDMSGTVCNQQVNTTF